MQQNVDQLTERENPLERAILPQYKNAVPVIVTIVPVQAIDPGDGMEKIGVLAIERAIPPGLGKLALPGGYLEYEDWSAAGLRELYEETGLDLRHTHELKPAHVTSVEQGRRLLIFGFTEPVYESQLPPFTPNNECSKRVILFQPQELAFPSHTEALERFLMTVS